jgi:hypothetical protein
MDKIELVLNFEFLKAKTVFEFFEIVSVFELKKTCLIQPNHLSKNQSITSHVLLQSNHSHLFH